MLVEIDYNWLEMITMEHLGLNNYEASCVLDTYDAINEGFDSKQELWSFLNKVKICTSTDEVIELMNWQDRYIPDIECAKDELFKDNKVAWVNIFEEEGHVIIIFY